MNKFEKAISQCKHIYVERYIEEILTAERANLRIRIRFHKGHFLEINEAFVVEEDRLVSLDYRYHCQDRQNRLLFRYDNTPHRKKKYQGKILSVRRIMINHIDGNRFVVCIDNQGNEASLELWKIYQSLPDEEAENHNEIRVVDEEGEDYLYPAECFSPVSLKSSVAKTFIMRHPIDKQMA